MTPDTRTLTFASENRYLLEAGAIHCPGVTIRPGWLLVEKGLIADIGQGPAPDIQAEYIDLGRLFLTPGLIDAHVHLALDPGDGLGLEERLCKGASRGLTGLRDGGDKHQAILAARQEISRHFRPALSGTALHAPGRYGSFLGRPVGSRREMKTEVYQLAAAGVDQIKVMASGPVGLKGFGRIGPPQFDRDDIRYLAGLARECGLPLMAHANGPEAVSSCIEAGAASVEHGYFMGREALVRLADRETIWVPTITPMAALGRRESDPDRSRLIDRIVAHQVEQLALARQLGVKTAVGTDAGSPGVEFGPSFFEELAWFNKAGHDPDQIVAACSQAAELTPRFEKAFRLSPGYPAIINGFEAVEGLISNGPIIIARPKTT